MRRFVFGFVPSYSKSLSYLRRYRTVKLPSTAGTSSSSGKAVLITIDHLLTPLLRRRFVGSEFGVFRKRRNGTSDEGNSCAPMINSCCCKGRPIGGVLDGVSLSGWTRGGGIAGRRNLGLVGVHLWREREPHPCAVGYEWRHIVIDGALESHFHVLPGHVALVGLCISTRKIL